MDHLDSQGRFKDSAAAVLPSSPPALRLSEGNSSSALEHQTPTKPLWAPLETDAPITLDAKDEVHVCQLCGCWYETRKGLSSHARVHLRQIGIADSEIQGSPVDFLYHIMEEEDLKPISSGQQERLTSGSPPSSSSKHPSSSATFPPCKRPRVSQECRCILCGEMFENRKGLACHSRSHLRLIGVTDTMGKGSIDTIEELVSSGVLEAMCPPKSNRTSSTSAGPSLPPALALSQSPGNSDQSSPSPVNRAPKAKKGFRLAVDPLYRKPKPEPEEFEVSVAPEASNAEDDPAAQRSHSAALKALRAESFTTEFPPTVPCDFCGQLFETRKALSCHVRAHLRQLGLTWSNKTSPIDLLKEVMLHGEGGMKGPSVSGRAASNPKGSKRPLDGGRETASNSSASPLDYSMKEKHPPGKGAASHIDASCELCGFNFENRKALASHARAHLRQMGIIEWKTDGASSPIELLSDLIRRDPVKVAAITRRYRLGDLYIKKTQKSAGSPSLSTDSDCVPGGSSVPECKAGRDEPAVAAVPPRQPQVHARATAGHSNPGVRSQRGVHPPKHAGPPGQENRGRSQHPPRSGSIPAMLPKPPLTPLVKLVGKIYSLKCRFCEEVFHGPLSVQEQWITHLQKHILTLGYKGKASPPAVPAALAAAAAPALVPPVAV